MSIYNHIDNNRRHTIFIILLFPLALFLLLGLAVFAYSFTVEDVDYVIDTARQLFAILLGVSVLWLLWITVTVHKGRSIILNSAKAKKIAKKDNPELYRIVENLAIASGLPCPDIYIIDDESLNAFAVGTKPENSAVAFTTGILAKLEKNELEAVAAHELAHIGNRDNYLMTVIVLGIGIFSFLGEIFLRISAGGSRSRSRSRNNNKGQGLIMLIGIALLLFGYVIAPFIKFALSRRREYQADATAALLTRYPLALASALEKIAVDSRVEVLDAMPNVGALCIANPLSDKGLSSFMNKMSGLTATHPPINQRITMLRQMDNKYY